MKNFKILALLNLLVVYVVWGSTFFGMKLALEGGMSPSVLVGLRFLVAGSMLYGAVRLTGVRAATRQEWKEAAVLSFLLLVCGTGLVAWSQKFISSSLAALLVATSPVWITMMDSEQKLTARKWLGLTVGLVGVGSLVGASLSMEKEGFLWGCLACLASAVAWAVGSLRARRTVRDISPIAQAGMQMMSAGFTLLLFALLKGEAGGLYLSTPKAWTAWLYLTLIGSVVAYSSYTWLVRNTSAALVSTHAYVNPVVAVLLGALLGGEEVTLATGASATVAIVGVIILMLPESALKLAPVPLELERRRAFFRHFGSLERQAS